MYLLQLKGMQCSDVKTLHIKGVPSVNRTYTRGVPFLSNMVYKKIRGANLQAKRDKHCCEML